MKRILTTLSQKWPEYLLEILVLIIGIYGAFAVDNWNEERKERKQEQVLLIQLRQEYTTNLTQLDSKIATRKVLINSSKKLLEDFNHTKNANLDSVLLRLSNLGLTVTYDPIDNDLVSSGIINLIQNQELKTLLTRWSTDVIQVQEVEKLYLDRYHKKTINILMQLGLGRKMDELFFQSIQSLDFTINNDNLKKVDLGDSRFQAGKSEILNHVGLEGMVSNSIMISEFINIESFTLRNQIIEILKLLEKEIK